MVRIREEAPKTTLAAVATAQHSGVLAKVAEPPRVLVVADEDIAGPLRSAVTTAGFLVCSVADAGEALEIASEWKPQLALIDGKPQHPGPSDDPAALIAKLKQAHGCQCVLMLPAAAENLVTRAHRADADSVLLMPHDPAELQRVLAHSLASARPKETEAAQPELPSLVIGSSAAMRDLWARVMLAARSPSPLVINGEMGVGKEVIARALHRFSPRRGAPFVTLSCADVPEARLDTELFGDGSEQNKGCLVLAQEGTLFLDAIGDLPMALQLKLLRVLQERNFEHGASAQRRTADVRIVVATERDLDAAVKESSFRADLFYRLNVLSLRVPPLKERKSDVLSLWQHFIDEGAARQGRPAPQTDAATQALLLRHDWPGNVREVYNTAQHALTVVRGSTITPAALPSGLSEPVARMQAPRLLGLTMQEVERRLIVESYEAFGTVKATAEALGISPRKLHYRLHEYRKEGRLPPRSRSRPLSEDFRSLAPAPRSARHRIVLAESDDESRATLSDFLRNAGYEVVAVPNAPALLQHMGAALLFEQGDGLPDLIMIEADLPNLSGMQLLESARKRSWQTPIVLINAREDSELRDQAEALGVTAFLSKPLDLPQLQLLLRDVMPR